MKEELLKKARELAEACRKSQEDLQKGKKEADLRRYMGLLVAMVRDLWTYVGFCQALQMIGDISAEDLKEINKIVLLENSEVALPPNVIDFINKLDDIDKI